MLEETEFINAVWKKYDRLYNNRKSTKSIYKKLVYKTNQKIIKIKTLILLLIYILTASSVVYAGVTTYKIIQKNTSTNFQAIQGFEYSKDMILNNGMYYKKIYSYQEYNEAQKIWKDLVFMTEKDFNDNLLIVIAGENYNTTSLHVSNIYNEESKLFIELKKNNEWNENNTVISTIISRELDREQVELVNLPMEVNTKDTYIDIESIKKDYSIEEAKKDNCFVLNEKHQIISDDKEQFNKFADNCNNKIDDIIRIVIFDNDKIIIYDLESKDNKINMLCKEIGGKNNTYSFIGTVLKIENRPEAAGGGHLYALYDDYKERRLICTVLD